MPQSPLDYLQHIQDEADYLISRSQGLEKSAFLHDETLKRAFTRSIEIIGEAVKQLPLPLREKYPLVDWRAFILTPKNWTTG